MKIEFKLTLAGCVRCLVLYVDGSYEIRTLKCLPLLYLNHRFVSCIMESS